MAIRDSVQAILAEAIDNKIFPGCVIGFVTKDVLFTLPLGSFTYDKKMPRVLSDTVYDVASLSKVLPTSSLAFQFIQEKKIGFDTKLIAYIPEYVGSYREDISVLHLLNQTMAFPFSLSTFRDKTAKEILAIIFNAQLGDRPGVKYCYSNSSSILLGLLLERVSGRNLSDLADKYFFTPLGMKHTGFHPEHNERERIAPTEIEENGLVIQGVVHDESARVFASENIVVGSAGLFSTVPDLLIFLQMVLCNGKHEEKIVFTKDSIQRMSEGIGWESRQPWMGKKSSEKAFGKTGFTGCFLFVDPVRKIGIVMLSNRTYPKRSDNKKLLVDLRARVIDAIVATVAG